MGYFHKKVWGLVLISILLTVCVWTCRKLDSGVLADTVYGRSFRLCRTTLFATPVCMLFLVTLTQFQGSSNIKTRGIAAICIFQRSLYFDQEESFYQLHNHCIDLGARPFWQVSELRLSVDSQRKKKNDLVHAYIYYFALRQKMDCVQNTAKTLYVAALLGTV